MTIEQLVKSIDSVSDQLDCMMSAEKLKSGGELSSMSAEDDILLRMTLSSLVNRIESLSHIMAALHSIREVA